MKAVIQIVQDCSLIADGEPYSSISNGMLILLGIKSDDTPENAQLLADRILKTRIFPDENDRINLAVTTGEREIMVVSNFTLYADCAKSRRPDFFRSAKSDVAKPLYEYFLKYISLKAKEYGSAEGATIPKIANGKFGADMKISFTADGPITVIIDTDELMK